MHRLIYALLATIPFIWHGNTTAQDYPARPVRLIMPYPAGGATDIVGRLVAQNLSSAIGQPVVVDNRPGASALLGTEAAAKSPPDGYSLLMATSTNAINQTLHPKLPYDFLTDFQPVTLIAKAAQILIVHPSVPVRSVKELIALARSKPGQLNYASAGVGVSGHLAMEALKYRAKVNLVHIPYKGGAPALTDLLGGQVTTMFTNTIGVLPYIKAGRLRSLGVTSAQRSALTPDVPTIAEAGYPGFEVTAWFGITVPKGTPQAIVSRLNSELLKLLNLPQVQERLLVLGAERTPISSPEQFAQFLRTDIDQWAEMMKIAGVKTE